MAPELADGTDRLSPGELREAWPLLLPEDRLEAFRTLDQAVADDFFLSLSARNQASLLMVLPEGERRLWMRLLAPDDAADVIQNVPNEDREGLLSLLDDVARHEVRGLLAYAEDDAGGLMNPRFARVRPDMTVDEAIIYLRRQVRESPGSLHYAYVTDQEQRLVGVVSFREFFGARPDQQVKEIMRTSVVAVPEAMDQEDVSRMFAQHHLIALPVVDDQWRLKGVVTADDIVEVISEEDTEDIQKMGGTEALGAPYLQIRPAGHDPQARRLAVGAVPGRNADRHGDGLLRGRDRTRRGAGAVRAADDLERRQLGEPGHHARDPRARARRSAAARLVARGAARISLGARPRRHPGHHRRDPHHHLADAVPHLRRRTRW